MSWPERNGPTVNVLVTTSLAAFVSRPFVALTCANKANVSALVGCTATRKLAKAILASVPTLKRNPPFMKLIVEFVGVTLISLNAGGRLRPEEHTSELQ